VADYGRLASEFMEIYADESTELGRVASLHYEINATESTEKGRISALHYEVNATESTEKGRIAALHYEINAKEERAVRVSTLFAEVFLVPLASDPAHYVPRDVVGTRTMPYFAINSVRRRR